MVGFESEQVIGDEFVDFDSQNAGTVSVSGEDFFVDHFLNLNDVEEKEEEEDNGGFVVVKEEPFEETEMLYCEKLSVSPLETEQNTDDFGSVLSVPAEEADLEWLSQFVEESFSQYPTPSPAQFGPISVQPKPKPKPGPETRPGPCFVPPLSLSKSRRSNRARTGCRVWPTVTTTSFHPSNPARTQTLPQRQRKKGVGPGNGPTRRCSHCGVQKTPQWRAGPNGSKTLCNACGVRYKSGRLLPEYRPACSPTFSSELHSNSHRKVLEMRRKKESTMSGRPEPGLSNPVSSFG